MNSRTKIAPETTVRVAIEAAEEETEEGAMVVVEVAINTMAVVTITVPIRTIIGTRVLTNEMVVMIIPITAAQIPPKNVSVLEIYLAEINLFT